MALRSVGSLQINPSPTTLAAGEHRRLHFKNTLGSDKLAGEDVRITYHLDPDADGDETDVCFEDEATAKTFERENLVGAETPVENRAFIIRCSGKKSRSYQFRQVIVDSDGNRFTKRKGVVIS